MRALIVGNGIAGLSCAFALRAREPDAQITVVGRESKYMFSRTALMYAFMNKLKRPDLEPFEREVYSAKRIELVHANVTDLDAIQKRVTLSSSQSLSYDSLVLATGAIPQLFHWVGLEQELENGRNQSVPSSGLVHFVSLQDLDACESLVSTTQEAVVVGGGLIGIELVECLAHQGIKVTFLIREPFFWPVSLCSEEASMVTEEIRRHGVEVIYGDEIKEVQKDSSGRVSQVITQKGKSIPCKLLGICVGVKPNIAEFQRMTTPPKTRRGFLVDSRLQTSLPEVFACGDCAEILLPNADGSFDFDTPGASYSELIWYSAKRQGELVAQSLLGDRVDYKPPLFFNSSKFFELEYTTVGEVQKHSAVHPSLFLQGKVRGQVRSFRIVHDGHKVLGFNVLGARVEHNVLAKWIHERRSPDHCLKHLKQAQFDVEFGRVPFEVFPSDQLSPHNQTSMAVL